MSTHHSTARTTSMATVERLGGDGNGIARTGDGRILVLPGALAGETVAWSRRREHSRHVDGRVEAILEPSPERVDPLCRHFDRCGGCKLQHLAAPSQLAAKQAQLLSTLRRVGRVEPEHVLPAIAGPHWHYRRRARLGVKYLPGRDCAVVGFRARHGTKIAELDVCEVLDTAVGDHVAALAAAVGELSIRDRIPQIEVATGDNAAALVLRVLAPPAAADRERLAAFGRDRDICMYLQPGGPDTVAPLDPAAPPLYYDLPAHDVRLHFGPTEFIQVNGAVNRALVDTVVDLLDPAPGDRALDLFSGLGNFSLPLARRAAEVIAVEGDAAAVARGRDNARTNRLGNASFHHADLFAAQRKPGWLAGTIDRVLLDPPRNGAREILPLVAAKQPRRIVYVSCHPATLARDAAELAQRFGYELAAAGVADMFPHTSHVESIAMFERG